MHPILQFTFKTAKWNVDLDFPGSNLNVDGNKQVRCACYQKPADRGTLLILRSCARLQYKKNLREITVQRVFGSKSTRKKVI